MKKIILMVTILLSTATFAEGPTLQSLMATMGQKAQAILVGMIYDDFEMIEDAASWVNNHAEPTADLAKIKEELGYQAIFFKMMDTSAHNAANAIIEGAQEKNMKKISKNYAKMVKSCTRCHGAFRERLRVVLHKDM